MPLTIGADNSASSRGVASEADWHLLECGGYGADLGILRKLAAGHERIADLGCGCGRVSRELARDGSSVIAIDRDSVLLASLDELAGRAGLIDRIQTVEADITEVGWSHGLACPTLAIAAMQLWQVISSAASIDFAREIARWLSPGGLFAVSVLDAEAQGSPSTRASSGGLDGLRPNLREVDGWVLSSSVSGLRESSEAIEVRRLREEVSPGGEVSTAIRVDRLRRVSPGDAEHELRLAGLMPRERIAIPAEAESVACVMILAEVAS